MRCLPSPLTFLQNIQSLLFTSDFGAREYFGETERDATVLFKLEVLLGNRDESFFVPALGYQKTYQRNCQEF